MVDLGFLKGGGHNLQTKKAVRWSKILHHLQKVLFFGASQPVNKSKRGGGGGILHVHIYFPIGPTPLEGGHVPEMPPPPLNSPMLMVVHSGIILNFICDGIDIILKFSMYNISFVNSMSVMPTLGMLLVTCKFIFYK